MYLSAREMVKANGLAIGNWQVTIGDASGSGDDSGSGEGGWRVAICGKTVRIRYAIGYGTADHTC